MKILGFIIRNRGWTVSAVARGVNLTVVAASEYLRVLEAEGLVRLRRHGTWVECWPADSREQKGSGKLVTALRGRLRQDKKAIESVFKLATGFTHARRVEVYQALRKKALSLGELKAATGIPGRPLLRHLQKLKARGFVIAIGQRPQGYAIKTHVDRFGRALAHFVVESR